MKFQNPRYINKMGDPEYMKFLPNGEDRNANYGTPRIKSPKEMIDYVHKQNAHIMISVWYRSVRGQRCTRKWIA